MPSPVISIPEIIKTFLLNDHEVASITEDRITIGAASNADQVAGAVSILPAGQAATERYTPLVKQLLTVRAHGPSVDAAQLLGNVVHQALHETRRTVVEQADGESYLVHYISITGGPALTVGEFDNLWETLLTFEVMAGTEPLL